MSQPLPETIAPLPSHLEEVRGRLQAAWQGAAPGATLPRIEDQLEGLADGERLALLRELVPLEIAYRLQRGEQPRAEEYRARFPELQAEWLAGALETPPLPRQCPTLRCPHCHNPIQFADEVGDEVLCPGCGGSFRVRDARLTDTASASRPLGRFQLLERVGQGAFGAVWKARDTALDRVVALKVLHSGLGTDDQEMQRFQREARAAAQLRHPGIVTVHEVLSQDGLPVLVADFVHGVTLREFLQVRRLTFRESAQLVADLAEALDYAHGMGVIHRDLKPANIMLEAAPSGGGGGELGRPLLTDFGLALRGEAEVTLTLDGHVLGTPAYMSPEQAAGKSHLADRRSDVYSLGVILYELLAGELPFRGSRAMLLYQVLREEPKPPRQLNARVPRDLETVCLKCLQKEPNKRYGSARELADDLKRFLAGEAVRARPVGRAERAWRWCRRNPVVAGLIAAVFLALAAGALVATVFAIQAEARARQALAEKERADGEAAEAERARQKASTAEAAATREATAAREAERLAGRRAYGVGMLLTQSAWEQHQVDRFLQLLEEQRPRKAGDEDFRGFEWFYWKRQFQRGHTTFKGHNRWVKSVAFSSDGKRLVSAGWGYDQKARQGSGEVKVWDAHTGQEQLTLRGLHVLVYYSVAFSADGKHIVSGGWCHDQKARQEWGEVRVWDAQTGQARLTLKGHTRWVSSVASSADGKRLASGSGDQTVRVWDAHTGQELLSLKGHISNVYSVAFSPDGKRIASGGQDSTVRVWDAQTGQQALSLTGHTSPVGSVAFSPDGRRIASGGWDGIVKVWDAHTGQGALTLIGHLSSVMSVAFSPDGKRIVSGGIDKTVRVWDAQTGHEQLTLKGHTAEVKSVAFSGDGKRLASGSEDGRVKVWDAQAGQQALTLRGHTDRVRGVAFSADGKRLASGSGEFKGPGEVRVWDAQTGHEQLTLKGHTSEVMSVSFSADGKRLAAGSWDKTVKVWDAQTGQEQLTLRGHNGWVRDVAFSADGKRLASASGGVDRNTPKHWGEVRVWDAQTGQELLSLKGHTSEVESVAFSPDGKRLAAGSFDKTVRVWDAHTGQEILTLKGHTDPVTSVAFSADGKRIASGSWDKTVKVWDAQTGQEQLTLKGHTLGVSSVAFSPDGKRIASGGDKTVKVWDAQTGQETLTLKGHTGPVRTVAFSGDGKRIASGSEDRTVKVWDASLLP